MSHNIWNVHPRCNQQGVASGELCLPHHSVGPVRNRGPVRSVGMKSAIELTDDTSKHCSLLRSRANVRGPLPTATARRQRHWSTPPGANDIGVQGQAITGNLSTLMAIQARTASREYGQRRTVSGASACAVFLRGRAGHDQPEYCRAAEFPGKGVGQARHSHRVARTRSSWRALYAANSADADPLSWNPLRTPDRHGRMWGRLAFSAWLRRSKPASLGVPSPERLGLGLGWRCLAGSVPELLASRCLSPC
jgi:hypothetical protein